MEYSVCYVSETWGIYLHFFFYTHECVYMYIYMYVFMYVYGQWIYATTDTTKDMSFPWIPWPFVIS